MRPGGLPVSAGEATFRLVRRPGHASRQLALTYTPDIRAFLATNPTRKSAKKFQLDCLPGRLRFRAAADGVPAGYVRRTGAKEEQEQHLFCFDPGVRTFLYGACLDDASACVSNGPAAQAFLRASLLREDSLAATEAALPPGTCVRRCALFRPAC